MSQEHMREAINQVLMTLSQERGGNPENWEEVRTPDCIIDTESYELLVRRSRSARYPDIFTDAVRSLRPLLTPDQLRQVALAVKAKRSKGRHKCVHSRIEKGEFGWVLEMANLMETKPARVLESILFLYLRASDVAHEPALAKA